MDDLSAWWRDLDLEQWAKGVLDDIETAVTGSSTLREVAFSPDAEWQPDDARGTCNLCDKAWGITRRRHHCRHCGLLFCGDCADHFLYLTQNKIRFKFRICSDCNEDDETIENVKNGGAQAAIEGVTRVVQAVGAATRQHRKSNVSLAQELKLPKNDELMKALGMEEGEEFAIGLQQSAVVVASPEDPLDAKGHTEDPNNWWDDTFFDGGGIGGGEALAYTGDHVPTFMQERFLSYSDLLQETSAFDTVEGDGDGEAAVGTLSLSDEIAAATGGARRDDEDSDPDVDLQALRASLEEPEPQPALPACRQPCVEPDAQDEDLPEPIE
jgi:hypothetical protein